MGGGRWREEGFNVLENNLLKISILRRVISLIIVHYINESKPRDDKMR